MEYSGFGVVLVNQAASLALSFFCGCVCLRENIDRPENAVDLVLSVVKERMWRSSFSVTA